MRAQRRGRPRGKVGASAPTEGRSALRPTRRRNFPAPLDPLAPAHPPRPSEITPHALYTSRRDWMRQVALAGAGTAMAAWASRQALAATPRPGKLAALPGAKSAVPGAVTMEKLTTYAHVTT